MLKTVDDCNIKFDRVYNIEGETFVITKGNKYTVLAKSGDELRCFYPTYFEYLIETGHAILLETGQPN